MTISILGISAFYHDSAAAIVVDGTIIAAAQEERFSRIKHDAGFPAQAIDFCLKKANIQLESLDHVVFYDKPILKFERLLETYLSFAPKGIRAFAVSMPIWLKEKLFLKIVLKRELSAIAQCKRSALPPLLFTEHHQSHAASAFYPSPFERAAVLCVDGVGEWATTSVWLGSGHKLVPQWQINFPHSLGLLYSALTYYLGFKVNSGEYKVMGLAPYGVPKYVDLILDNLMDLKSDGTFRLNMKYFNFATGLTMTNNNFDKLFGSCVRVPESEINQFHMDIAASIQSVVEEVMLRLSRSIRNELGADYLCLAGGVALNCVANGRILREGPFKDIWIQPAAGDAGGALGAALAIYHQYLKQPRCVVNTDSMSGALLGPSFTNEEIIKYLGSVGAVYEALEDAELMTTIAQLLSNGKIVGWFQGRMEFGPRALGARSILGDPRDPEMQSLMNLKIKHRESFRPFAPSVIDEQAHNFFDQDCSSPYMLLTAEVANSIRTPKTTEREETRGFETLKTVRSKIPAVTHVDHSARVQTVHQKTNSRFFDLLGSFEQLTGYPILINTSFNVRGEPIVCTPEDAYLCFMSTEIDYLVLENVLMAKVAQNDKNKAVKEFMLD